MSPVAATLFPEMAPTNNPSDYSLATGTLPITDFA